MNAADLKRRAKTRTWPVGATVRLDGVPYVVVGQDDESLIELRSEHGATLRLGRLAEEFQLDEGDGDET